MDPPDYLVPYCFGLALGFLAGTMVLFRGPNRDALYAGIVIGASIMGAVVCKVAGG